MEKYKSSGTLNKITHFHSVFCEVGVVQQCTLAQAGVVQVGLTHIPYFGQRQVERWGEGDVVFSVS